MQVGTSRLARADLGPLKLSSECVAGGMEVWVPAPAKLQRSRSTARNLSEGENYPRTDTPANESTARPRTGWPKKRAGSK
jgi:hypothetical protein